MSYSYLFKKAGRILKSYLNSTVSGDTFQSEKQKKIFEEYMRQEADKRYGSGSGSQSGSSSGSYQERTNRQQQQQQQQQQQTRSNIKNDEYYYGILGIKVTATNDEVKKAFKQIIVQYHPDKTTNLGVELQNLAKKKTQEINEAYNYIRKKRNF